METGKVVLDKLTLQDSEVLAHLANNIHIWNGVRDVLPHPYRLNDAVSFIRQCQQEHPRMTFAIRYDGAFCGAAGLVRMEDIYRNTAEAGYWVGEPYWNKGIATEALKLLCGYGFGVLQLKRIEAGVFENNEASKKVLKKSGFVLEGICKKRVIKNGVIMDEFRYARIDGE